MTSKIIGKPKEAFTLKSLLLRRIYILQWLPRYSKSDLISDFIAGLTIGLTMMPQAIAYAHLAGLQAQYGLYTAFIGSFTYVFLGTIKEVSIGPTSLMALLTFSYTEGLPIEFIILLTFLVGCVEIMMGVFKLGYLVDFMSPCVTSGFTSAMSVTIVASQLKNVFGLTKLKNHGVLDVVYKVFLRYREIKLADTLLGLSCIVFLFSFKQLPKLKVKNGIFKQTLWFLSISRNAIVVLLTSLLGFYYYEYCGGSPFILSGAVPQGLPQVIPPKFTVQMGNETWGFGDMVNRLGSSIIVVPIAAVLANVAIAKAFASGVVVDATQEMVTLGICNVLGSFVQAMPSCGAFTRSAVSSSSGVRTPLQGVYSGTIILLALSFLTPYFYYIPRSTLGAVLISAIITMFDYEIFPKLWKCNKFDFLLTLATLSIGVFGGVEIGIIAGGLINILTLLKPWNRPLVETTIKTDDKGNNYIYVRPEIGLYYPAIDYLTTKIAEAHCCAKGLPIALDCVHIIDVDYAGCLTIENLVTTYCKKDVKFTLLNVSPQVYHVLQNTVNLSDLELCRSLHDLSEPPCKCKTNTDTCETPLLNNGYNNCGRKLSYYDNA